MKDARYVEWLKDTVGTEDAAQLLGVTQDHIDELCKRGKIKCKRIGSHSWAVYYPGLEQYLKSKSTRGKSPSRKPKIGY